MNKSQEESLRALLGQMAEQKYLRQEVLEIIFSPPAPPSNEALEQVMEIVSEYFPEPKVAEA